MGKEEKLLTSEKKQHRISSFFLQNDRNDALNSVNELKGFKQVNINHIRVEPNFHEGIHVFKGRE